MVFIRLCALRGAVVLSACCMANCGTLNHWADLLSKVGRKHPEKDSTPKADQLIGVVDMVNPERRFVLIRNQSLLGVSPGAALEAKSPSGNKSKLTAGAERKQSFISADIVEGTPQAGDLVFIPAALMGTNHPTLITVQPKDISASGSGSLSHAASSPSEWHRVQGAPSPDSMVPGVPPSPGSIIPGAPPGPSSASSELPPPIR